MRRSITFLLLFLLSVPLYSQWKSLAHYNRYDSNEPSATMPWNVTFKNTYAGVRSIHITDDLDGDGKLEVIAPDYSNGGRVHVFEFVDENTWEMVWSSPSGMAVEHDRSTPRWVQTGDLDGDGLKEIIFPVGSPNRAESPGKLLVFEYQGVDNDYGIQTIIDFPQDQFAALGIGNFNSERERGTVYDFDGDGVSELIWGNSDNKVYILSINGNAPGFASWQIEGGDPNVDPVNWSPGGSHWHSIAADIDGDGKLEIVNHYFDYLAFSSIDVDGPDSYTYSKDGNPGGGGFGPYYYQFMRTKDIDGVSWMGIVAADVDGDGKNEIAATTHYAGDVRFGIGLISIGHGEDGIAVWDDSSKYAQIATRFDLGEDDGSNFWSVHAADLDGDGKDEILAGGFYGENVVEVKYKGEGDILDPSSYEITTLYAGEPEKDWEWLKITVSDSTGVVDTTYSTYAWGNPGVMKMATGDLTGDGNIEIALAYQQDPPYDETEYTFQTWNGTSWTTDSVVSRPRPRSVNIRILAKDPGTGVYEPLNVNLITPDEYVLEQNYPNPFNPSTTIRFSLPVNKQVSLIVYDMLGREVKTLIANEEIAKGAYEVDWDGTNNLNEKVASGNYIATLKFGNYHKSVKMSYIK